jgi:hypothetical protein
MYSMLMFLRWSMHVTKRAKGGAMRRVFFNAFLVFLVVALAGCSRMESERHKHLMKGQILDVIDNSAYLCIGSKDGAEVGDQFAVYKFTRGVNPDSTYTSQPYYKRDQVGKIKITEIFDEHMAKANILSGEVKSNYFVELED